VASLIASVSAQGAGTAVTSGAIITFGADAIIAFTSGLNVVADLTDSKGNTYTQLPSYGSTLMGQIWYVLNPIVSANGVADHTFTATSHTGSVVTTLASEAWASGASGFAYDSRESGNSTSSGGSLQPGSVTPSANGALVFTGVSWNTQGAATVDSPFTRDEHLAASASTFSVACASVIQGTAGALNPTWTIAGGGAFITVAQAVFTVTGGGGSAFPHSTIVRQAVNRGATY
jgi:hypothetical protein